MTFLHDESSFDYLACKYTKMDFILCGQFVNLQNIILLQQR